MEKNNIMEKDFDNYAFISYNSKDDRWAKWLQRKLETYRLPTIIANEKPELPKKIEPVFRFVTSIGPGPLSDVLKDNLSKSKYLIVICSPLSAKSKWVGEEILEFIKQEKRDNIILFIVDGEPYSNDPERECYHPVIKNELPEMLGVNVQEKGDESVFFRKQKAFIKVVSRLLNVSVDSLWQRQKIRIIRNWIISISVSIMMILLLVGVSMYQKKINQPFDVSVSLNETTPCNINLPFENGKVYLCYDNDTLVSNTIQNYDDVADFTHIPGKYREKTAMIWFEMHGFEKIENVVKLMPGLILPISRDDTYGIVKGNIFSFNGKPVDNATIIVGGKETHSNSEGAFEICFDYPEQTITKDVAVKKSGFIEFKGKYTVNQDWKIVIEKQ